MKDYKINDKPMTRFEVLVGGVLFGIVGLLIGALMFLAYGLPRL